MNRPNRTDWIQTFTGRQFWPLAPQACDVDPVDIAHALAMKCRYTGHCLRFYSVAEHSCHLFDRAEPEDKAWALLHDAPEAYLPDIARPIKPAIPGFDVVESGVMDAVCIRFGLPLEMPEAVKILDTRILADELAQNMALPPKPWGGLLPPLEVTLRFWSPERAAEEFLDRLDILGLVS